ncbi:MAG: imidazole glycerol phosphate synthase subunit HisH, partial [Gammaproteobacteria bacterium]|nr:imidazole glycerol phosphate synthase subunit HisH [Gammaproteobacteria bacterium]
MELIIVIDYHMGNLRSVSKALEHEGGDRVRVEISSDPTRIAQADRVVFPGQGAARDCMSEIHRLGLGDCIRSAIDSKPFLGICMGLEVLLEVSDESPETPCLGVFEGRVRKLPIERVANEQRLSLPQMGWNTVHYRREHPLWHRIADGSHFYFANSYHVCPEDESVVMATTPYAIDFVSAIGRGSLFAVQFHPEKSQ